MLLNHPNKAKKIQLQFSTNLQKNFNKDVVASSYLWSPTAAGLMRLQDPQSLIVSNKDLHDNDTALGVDGTKLRYEQRITTIASQ